MKRVMVEKNRMRIKDGVEKLKKKKKLKSCPPSENASIEFKENSSNIDLNKIINLKNKQNSRNIYYIIRSY